MLEGVAKCRRDYEPFIVNLERLHDKRVSRSCTPRSAPLRGRDPHASSTEHEPRLGASSPVRPRD